jgi:heme exporter protein B
MTRSLLAIIRRDLRLGVRAGGSLGTAFVFFLAIAMVVPFSIGPDLGLLVRVGGGMVWVGALLASLLGLDRIFGADAEDGSLDLLQLSPLPLELVVAAKGIAHWLITGLSIALAVPLFGILLGMNATTIMASALLLLIGTPAITAFGLIGAALAVALPRSGMLTAVLVLPFTIPVLIFGSAATDAIAAGHYFGTPVKLLLAVALFSFVIGPVAAAAALRIGRSA